MEKLKAKYAELQKQIVGLEKEKADLTAKRQEAFNKAVTDPKTNAEASGRRLMHFHESVAILDGKIAKARAGIQDIIAKAKNALEKGLRKQLEATVEELKTVEDAWLKVNEQEKAMKKKYDGLNYTKRMLYNDIRASNKKDDDEIIKKLEEK